MTEFTPSDTDLPDFDYNAGGPPDPRVLRAMDEAGPAADGNPHAPHARGRAARSILEGARERVAAVLGRRADEVVFCSGGTEANNLALATGLQLALQRGLPLAFSPIEHPSVDVPARALVDAGAAQIVELPCHEGSVSVEASRPLAFASCIHAQGEFGFVQDLRRLRTELDAAGGGAPPVLHSDASQSLGRLALDAVLDCADLVTLSPHKAGGPRGIGILVKREAVPLAPLMRGGSQELGERPGTQSPRLAVGAARAVELAVEERVTRARSMHECLRIFLDTLAPLRGLDGAAQQLQVLGLDLFPRPDEDILPNTRTLCVPGVHARVLLPALDMHGIGVSYGSACSSGSAEPSPALRALGLTKKTAESCIRVSLGPNLELGKVGEAASLFLEVLRRFPSKSSASTD